MNETRELIVASAMRLFETRLGADCIRGSRAGRLPKDGWASAEEAGLPLALLTQDEGGFGLDLADAFNLVRIGGYFASPLPLAETMLANLLFARVGVPLVEGPATFARLDEWHVSADGSRLTGTARAVPWARHAATLALAGGDSLYRVPAADAIITPDFSACGLPRDLVRLDVAIEPGSVGRLVGSLADVRAAGALLRSLEMAGALQRVAELTVAYASERIQFGKPIGKQQAVQQLVATLAGQAAAANASADLAALAFDGPDADIAIAAAKSRVGEAAGIGAGIAHQVHGAIGFTEEHRLHIFTRALWAWRDEYGAEAYWEEKLGTAALAGSGDGFWPFVTGVQAEPKRGTS